jgi:signal transduction histidine kinase
MPAPSIDFSSHQRRLEASNGGPHSRGAPDEQDDRSPRAKPGSVLLVEDDRDVRETLGDLLEAEGYEVVCADNGQDALGRLRTGQALPDVIVLDLNMPVMDGWQFRAIQKDDPALSGIPVVAVSADRSAPAVAISSQAYIQKPFDFSSLLRTIERVLFESEREHMSARLEQAERLASLGRIAAGVGHEINNPLMFALLNLQQSLAQLRSLPAEEVGTGDDVPAARPSHPIVSTRPTVPAPIPRVIEMLRDCEIGLERIRQTVGNLQSLSRHGAGAPAAGTAGVREPVDVCAAMEESISMAWNQIRHRAQLVRVYSSSPTVLGNASALGQVFLNVLVNGAQSIPEGGADRNELRVSIAVVKGEVVVEVRDTGSGIPPDVLPHVFDPFFTTKAVGVGTGLGLSISRETVTEAGGSIALASEPGRGTSCRIVLPCLGAAVARSRTRAAAVTVAAVAAVAAEPTVVTAGPATPAAPAAGRVMVIDDEEAIGRVVARAFSSHHQVTVVQRAADAFARFAAGDRYDLVLCDLLMPSVSGPEVHSTIAARWPELLPNLVFMTGGAFTPATAEFVGRALTPLLYKPFRAADVAALLEQRLRAATTAATKRSSAGHRRGGT